MSETVSDEVCVIFNPASSHGAGARIWPSVKEALRRRGLAYELHTTEEPGHASQLAAQVSVQEGRTILVVGGDGTLHEVANGVPAMGRDPPPLAIVPVGTGNDFYRMVGVPRSIDRAIDLLRSHHLRS